MRRSGAGRPRVAVVYHFVASYRGPIFARLCRDPRLEVHVFADPVNRLMPGVQTWQGIEEVNFHPARCFKWRRGPMWQSGLIRLALDPTFDAIIYLGQADFLATWLSAFLARRKGKRVLFWTHGWRAPDRGLKRRVRLAFYRLADGMLLYGNRAREIGLAEGFESRDLHVIYNSLDHERQKKLRATQSLEDLRKLRDRLFVDGRRPVAVCVTRLQASKRLDLLIEAAALLAREGRPLNVLIVGDGDERGALEALAQQRDVDAHFTGACYDEAQLAGYIMASNVTVSPGVIGLTAIQSLAYGTPVVTSDDMRSQGPEVEAIVPDVTGSLYPFGDVRALADCISRWTGSEFVLDDVRRRCHEIVDSHYNPEYQVNELVKAVLAGVGDARSETA